MNSALIGVPVSARNRVLERLTVPGALDTAVKRWSDDDADELAEAIASVETGLDRYASNAAANPYHRNIATTYYDVPGLQGLEGDWSDVFKSFVGQVGVGVAGKIAGANPFITSQTVVQAPPRDEIPWGKIALLAGGGIAAFLVIKSLVK